MIELNKYILKSLKLPGVHIHPFPLLFWGIQRGVQPKLSALRLAPLEILRAKLSNQAAIQQRPAPLPVNHRLCCSSRSRDTVLGGFTDEWRGKSSCWNGAKNEFYSERKEQVKIWAVQVTYKSPSHYGDVKRVHTGSVCWGERRKNHVQPFDSLTFGAHLLLRLKPFFVSLLYIFCPSLTNRLMQSVKMWELETWQEIFSCPGLQDGKQRGDEPPVAGYYWVEMKFFNLSHLTMAAWNICFFFFYIQYVELFTVNPILWVRPEVWCGGKLTDWHCEGTSEMKMFPCRAGGGRWMFDEDRDDVNLMLRCRRPHAGRPVTCVTAAGCTVHVS